MKRVLVTGGLGQIGSHVVEMLLERGDQVVAIDNLATGRREHLADHPNLTVVIDTIADKVVVERLVSELKPDAIVHTAASYKDPDDWYNDTLTNCVGGSNVVDAAKKFAVGRFIYFQTALCYGLKPMQQPIRLDHPRFPGSRVTRFRRPPTSSIWNCRVSTTLPSAWPTWSARAMLPALCPSSISV